MDGSDVTLNIASIEEFYVDDHKRIEYSMDLKGNVNVPDNQLSNGHA